MSDEELLKQLQAITPYSPADAWEQMRRVNDTPGAAHREADDLLLGAFRYLGQLDLVRAFLEARERNEFGY